ncbi:hypothetical protein FHR75_003282 [Kineococcus radiotolerans]|uniref:Uncharacterized protein n=1 Tax=Kineococcus radiotolerans TaxID=131568 RepID=A0A7W4TP01_KINRA|nr:hypothetical protein [Kineococcus radiotolerans]MBB2902451.1 hypothetical protein [Kineococcus radiotolerans]
MSFDVTRGLPRDLQRPRSRHRWVDLVLDAAFSFTGPAQVSGLDEGPQRGPRTAEEATRGYAHWERMTVGGHSYLVERQTPAVTSSDSAAATHSPFSERQPSSVRPRRQ